MRRQPASSRKRRKPKPPDLSRPPEVGPVRPYHPPKRSSFRLANGLEVLVVTDRRFPMLSVRLGLRRGASALSAQEAGTIDALADLLTEGSRKRNAKELAEEADAIGGEIGASAGQDFAAIRAFALSEHAERLFDLVHEVALEPTFPQDEVQLRKQNMLEELKVSRSQPSFLSEVIFSKALYGSHPYSVIAPTEESIDAIRRERLAALHAEMFVPNLAAMVVVGDMEPKAVEDAVRSRFGPWARRADTPHEHRSAHPATERRVHLCDRPGSAQTDLRLGNLTRKESDPDYFPLLVLNNALGGSFASRLMTELRERKGYTYGISTQITAQRELAAFELATQIRTPVTGETVAIVLSHLERVRKEPISTEELDKAKNVLAGRYVRRMETQRGVADQFLRLKLYDLPADYLETFVSKINRVTLDEALAAANRNILPDHLAIAAVGDAERIDKDLAPYSMAPIRRVALTGDSA